MRNYILNGRTPVPVPDISSWAMWFEGADRTVAKTQLGEAEVSTVFLGIDHNFAGSGRPLLFETLVFGGKLDGEMERYATWEEAEAGHEAMVDRVKDAEAAQ